MKSEEPMKSKRRANYDDLLVPNRVCNVGLPVFILFQVLSFKFLNKGCIAANNT